MRIETSNGHNKKLGLQNSMANHAPEENKTSF